MSILSPKCRFLFVSFLDSESVVYISDVVFSEKLCFLNDVLDFVD